LNIKQRFGLFNNYYNIKRDQKNSLMAEIIKFFYLFYGLLSIEIGVDEYIFDYKWLGLCVL